MADSVLTAVARRESPSRFLRVPVRVRYRLTPWWVKVVIVWALSRVITTGLMLWFADRQTANYWTGAHPSYLAFSQLWDSTWYHIVAVDGYPSVLPTVPSGHVGQNAWAFLPVYPGFVRIVMALTSLPWDLVSVLVSVAFSLASALVLFRLFRLQLPASTALFSVVLFCVAPLSPIYQVSYAESMYVFLLIVALTLVLKRHYFLLFSVVAVMSLTRPSGLAFALALVLHALHRWFTRVREPFPVSERILIVSLTAFSLLMGLAWPLIAWAVTGSFSAYTETELAWRADYIGYAKLVPFASWFQAAGFWGSLWGIGQLATVVLVAAIALFAASLFHPAVRRLGPDLRIWVASYGIYLLAVFFPQSSTFRLLMGMFPLLGALAQPRSRLYRVALVVLFIAGQFGWIFICWWVDERDWTPP